MKSSIVCVVVLLALANSFADASNHPLFQYPSFGKAPKVGNPFAELRRVHLRRLDSHDYEGEYNETDDDEGEMDGPPVCTDDYQCHEVVAAMGLNVSAQCVDGWIYGSEFHHQTCGIVCESDEFCNSFGHSVGWPSGSRCHRSSSHEAHGVCAFPGTVDLRSSNLCKDPSRFNATARPDVEGDDNCGRIAWVCHNLRPFGGITEMYRSMLVDQWAPVCCDGGEYNDDSGCGAMVTDATPVEEKMCGSDPENVFMPEAEYAYECKSPSDEHAEECHDEKCKTDKAYCESKRGQLVHEGEFRYYPSDLSFIPKHCNELLGSCASVGAFGVSYCAYNGTDGNEERCIEQQCSTDKESCLSREGTPVPTDPYSIYRNMSWVEAEKADIPSLTSHLSYLAKGAASCCSKGLPHPGKVPSCAPTDLTDKIHKSLGCEVGKFNFQKIVESSSHSYSCADGARMCSSNAATKGECRDSSGHMCHEPKCQSSQEGCHAMRGRHGYGFDLEFYPLTFAQAAERLLSAHDVLNTCCEGTKMLGECKPHPDVPDAPLICKPGTFQPSQTLPVGTCRSPHHHENEGIRSECWDVECRRNKTYCESKRSQMQDGEVYASDLTLFPTTCTEIQRSSSRINMVEKGECGEWVEDPHKRWFEDRCHDVKCQTQEGCASMGYEFKPLSQADADSRNRGFTNHYFGSESASSWGICCGGAENLQEYILESYPYSTEQVVPDGYVVELPKEGCSKCECCGEGTICKDGLCYPTFEGAIQACKKERGEDWAWTCDGEAQCSANTNVRRLKDKPKRPQRWSKGWHTAKPTGRRAASRPSSRPSSLFHQRRR